MASQRILATGSIMAGSDIQWNIAPVVEDFRHDDQDLGRILFESGCSRFACLNEDELIGYDLAAWEAAELEEYIDDIEDNIWHSRGGW